MNSEAIHRLFQYQQWANGRVWDCIEKLSDEQFRQDHDYSTGSIHNQVFHLMESELYTMTFFNKEVFAEMKGLKQEDFSTRAEIRTQWDKYIKRVDDVLATLTDEKLQSKAQMPSSTGTIPERPLWECLMAMINHATDHRAQILALIHQLGGETCEQGFFFFMLES
jgi:uncharacterized damage-inducible protein DinB